MNNYHKLKKLIRNNKWTLVISAWTSETICQKEMVDGRTCIRTTYGGGRTVLDPYICVSAIVCLYSHYASTSLITMQGEEDISIVPKLPKSIMGIEHYDVLLNGYMRSGSTLTGMILGWRDDAFYLYEPLWKISRLTYWHGNDTVCRMDRLTCRNVDPEKTVQDKTFPDKTNRLSDGSLVMAKKILRKFYDCQFNDFELPVLHPVLTVHLGGPSWAQIAACIKGKGTQHFCLHRYAPRKCKHAIHRVSKVLRLTTDLLGDMLRDRPNLKIIHLFRDPRAIINSRHKSWYPTYTTDKLIEHAKSLCYKMLHDLREGRKLLQLYPGRFKFIYYEDLTTNPQGKAKILYKYLGMDLNESKYLKVSKMAVFNNSTGKTKRQQNTAFWWRLSLRWDIVQQMEPVCSRVYKELGYNSISNLEDCRNLSINSANIPKQYLLT